MKGFYFYMAFDLSSKGNVNPHCNARSRECRHVRHFHISCKTFSRTHRWVGLSSTVLKISNGQIACQQQWRENLTSNILLSSAMGWQMKHEQTPEGGRTWGKAQTDIQKVGSFSFAVWAQRNQYPVLVLPVLFEHPFCLDYSLLLQEAFGAVTYSLCFLKIDLERKLYSTKVEDVLDPNASIFP